MRGACVCEWLILSPLDLLGRLSRFKMRSPGQFIRGKIALIHATLYLTILFLNSHQTQLGLSSVTTYMDSPNREAFLAAVDAEEEWLDTVSRRLSTGSPCPPPLGTSTPDPQRASDLSDLFQTPPAPSAGPVIRSGRKRKSTSEPLETRKTRMSSSAAPPPANDSTASSSGGASSSSTQRGSSSAVLDQLKDMMREMKEVREDVRKSESGTASRIDSLSKKMTDRLHKAEQNVKVLSKDVTFIKSDMVKVKKNVSLESTRLEKLIVETVDKKLSDRQDLTGHRPRQLPLSGANLVPLDGPAPPLPSSQSDAYLKARKSLKMWPVTGDNLPQAAVTFMETKLGLKKNRFSPDQIKITELYTGVDSPAQSQVLVEFQTVRDRDEIKALGKNLRGESSSVGIQMEIPDFLRGRFQTFQSLAFQLKKKNPALKRNIKFVDSTMELVMDIKLNAESEWKAVQYEDASAILPKTRQRTTSFSRQELATMVESPPSVNPVSKNDSSSDMDDDTLVDLTGDENIKSKDYSSHALSFINTNARSLGPKIELFIDCMEEKTTDVAFITETWY